MPDWIADAEGLYQADFDLLTRIPGLESLDIVSTEAVLASGFHERLHNWWPGLEETSSGRQSSVGSRQLAEVATSAQACEPVLITPPGASPDEPWWTLRDREEELVAIARQLKADRRTGDDVPLERDRDRLQEPAAVSLRGGGDLRRRRHSVPDVGRAAARRRADVGGARSGSRRGVVALLAQRADRAAAVAAFRISADGAEVTRRIGQRAGSALSAARYLGELDRLEALAGDCGTGAVAARAGRGARRGARAGAADRHASGVAAARLSARRSGPAHARPIADDDPSASRERRARAAIVDMLPSLAAVHAAHDDPAWTIDELGIAVRRWIEDQTFVPDPQDGRGVHLARRSGGPLRRLRRCHDRRRRRTGLAGAAAAQHLLSAGAAQGAGLAVGKGSPRRRRRAVPRSPDIGVAPHDGLDLHARRGCDRLAVDAARRNSARAAVDRRPRAVRGRPHLRRRSPVAGADRLRSLPGRRSRCGPRCGRSARPQMRPTSTAWSATSRRARGR